MLGITCLVLSFVVETIFVFGATILVKYKVSTGVCCRVTAKRRFWVSLIIWTVISTSLARPATLTSTARILYYIANLYFCT